MPLPQLLLLARTEQISFPYPEPTLTKIHSGANAASRQHTESPNGEAVPTAGFANANEPYAAARSREVPSRIMRKCAGGSFPRTPSLRMRSGRVSRPWKRTKQRDKTEEFEERRSAPQRGGWGYRPPDPGSALTSETRTPQIYIAYRVAYYKLFGMMTNPT